MADQPQRPEPPDKNCITLGDGSCASVLPCMHWPPEDQRPDAAREMLRWIEAYDGHSYCATQRGELDECDCGHEDDLDRWRDALARRAAEAPGDRDDLTVEEVAEWLRRAEGRIEDIFGLWVQGKRDDRWVAEKLIGEGHLRALAADSRPEQPAP